MVLPDWTLTAIVSMIGGLVGLVARQALVRMGEYHREAMRRLDALTTSVEAARQDLASHMRDHASGAFNHRRLE